MEASLGGDALPVVSLASDAHAAETVFHAASTCGFMYVRSAGTGIEAEGVERMFELVSAFAWRCGRGSVPERYLHGVYWRVFTAQIVAPTKAESREFFELPLEEKAKCAIGPDDRGWSSPSTEMLDPDNQKEGDLKEALNLGEFAEGLAQQPLPALLAAHQAELNNFAAACRALCMRLLQLFAIALEVPEGEGGSAWFSCRHDTSGGTSGSILRLLHVCGPLYCRYSHIAFADSRQYPPFELYGANRSSSVHANTRSNASSTDSVRAGAHTDFGSLTLLFQRPSQPGLEIQNSDTSWSPVPVYPPGTESDPFPPIVINIGDLLSYWTDGLLKSTMHRVNIPKRRKEDRYSIAYFCHPLAETELSPVPSRLIGSLESDGEDKVKKRHYKKTITAKEHLTSRLTAVYGWGST